MGRSPAAVCRLGTAIPMRVQFGVPILLSVLLLVASCSRRHRIVPPGADVLDLGGGVRMKLALLPAGSFLMGSPIGEQDRDPDEGPRHEVTISRPFRIGVHEVTQEQYRAVMGRNPSTFTGLRHPVEGIWWSDAVEFCRLLSDSTGQIVRLPTEAEWEYACRAGTRSRFSFGDDYSGLSRYGNYGERADTSGQSDVDVKDDGGHAATALVGSYAPNPWGLHDMHGNVFEWCGDYYADRYPDGPRQDPKGPPWGPYHVLRGGSWSSPGWMCRSAYRHRFTADGRFNHLIGFRVVVELQPPTDRRR